MCDSFGEIDDGRLTLPSTASTTTSFRHHNYPRRPTTTCLRYASLLSRLIGGSVSHEKQEGIIPAWEDEANKAGGKWSIQLPKEKNRANVDKMWLYTVSQ